MAKKTTANEKQFLFIDFSEEMRNSFRDYAVSVIVDRALPDVRDGLKPVQRRILYAMNELKLDPDKPHRKSARIVGDTMGKYHPHGDSSIYEALCHMSEDWSLNVPLIDGHGNFGSIDGDEAAAMRYTEARLSNGAVMLLGNMDKDLVDFVPNFDESEKEPKVLPAVIPNLLINGTTGIAVGMATNMPPHNAGEAIDAAIAVMDKPDISLDKLMEIIPGPDFPTGGIIINADEIRSIYETGEGKLKVRAKVEVEKGDAGRTNLVVTEIPYTASGNKTKLVESIVDLMKEKVFDEIYDVRDESSKEGIRIVIEVKKDRDVENLLNGLYKKTGLEDTYSVNMLAILDQQPITFSLIRLLQEFNKFQVELYTKEHKHLLKKAQDRLEIVSGLIKATDIIDLIIEILRGSSSVKQAKACLTKGDITDIKFKSEASKKAASKLDFTERQADAILSMQLSKLIGLEIAKLHEEDENLHKNIDFYNLVLSDEKELRKVIKGRLREFKKLFARERRTELANVEVSKGYVEDIKEENIYVLIDKFGYTKSMDEAAFSKVSQENLAEFTHIICMKNTDKLCLFTAEGNMHQLKGMSIPRGKVKDKGVLVHNLCKVGKEEIVFYTSFEDLFESQLFFATRKGYVKLVSGAEFETNRGTIAATKLDADDAVVGISQLSAMDAITGNRKVVMYTKNGMGLLYNLGEVSELKKTSRGVKGINLAAGDSVVYAGALPYEAEEIIYREKPVNIKKLKLQGRAGKGIKMK